MHKMEWSDVDRIIEAMDAPICANISLLNAVAGILGKLWLMVAKCDWRVRLGLLAGFLGLVGKDLVLQACEWWDWISVDERGRPGRPKAGGAGVSGEFSREKSGAEKSREPELPPQIPGLRR
jgi:hypothetical protein